MKTDEQIRITKHIIDGCIHGLNNGFYKPEDAIKDCNIAVDNLVKKLTTPVVSNCKLCKTSICKHRTYKEGKSVCKTSNDKCVYYY